LFYFFPFSNAISLYSKILMKVHTSHHLSMSIKFLEWTELVGIDPATVCRLNGSINYSYISNVPFLFDGDGRIVLIIHKSRSILVPQGNVMWLVGHHLWSCIEVPLIHPHIPSCPHWETSFRYKLTGNVKSSLIFKGSSTHGSSNLQHSFPCSIKLNRGLRVQQEWPNRHHLKAQLFQKESKGAIRKVGEFWRKLWSNWLAVSLVVSELFL